MEELPHLKGSAQFQADEIIYEELKDQIYKSEKIVDLQQRKGKFDDTNMSLKELLGTIEHLDEDQSEKQL